MLKLRVALAVVTVVAACNRSDRDGEVPASETPREHQDIAGARQPPNPDTVVAEPPHASAPRASSAVAERHPATREHRRRFPAPRPRAAERPDSAAAPAEVSAQPTRKSNPDASVDSAVSRDSVPSSDSSQITVPVASTPRDTSTGSDSTSSGRDTSVSRDTAGYSAYPGTASPPAPAARVVAAGTVIPVSLEDSINSRHDTWGKQLTGKVMQNITGPGGEVLVRAGSPLRLTVSRLRAGRGNGKGELEIQADSIVVQGHLRKLEAKVESVPYELKGRGVTGEEAAKVGVGAAGGAVVGGVITGKTKGAVIGGAVGAAAGAAVASQTAAKDVVVAARTPVRVVLTAPLVIR